MVATGFPWRYCEFDGSCCYFGKGQTSFHTHYFIICVMLPLCHGLKSNCCITMYYWARHFCFNLIESLIGAKVGILARWMYNLYKSTGRGSSANARRQKMKEKISSFSMKSKRIQGKQAIWCNYLKVWLTEGAGKTRGQQITTDFKRTDGEKEITFTLLY